MSAKPGAAQVYFADFQNEGEAHFVCGVLNSSLVKEYVESHTIKIQVSNIFKHLSIPRFDAKDLGHVALSRASLKAHAAKSPDARSKRLLALDKLAEVVLTA